MVLGDSVDGGGGVQTDVAALRDVYERSVQAQDS